MKKVMLISLFTLSLSIKGQSSVSGIKRTVVSVENSQIQQNKDIENMVSKKSNSTRMNSSLIRTIHSVSNLEFEKYENQSEIKKRVVHMDN